MKPEKIERRPSIEERLEVLRDLFPEVFTDGRVALDRLKELLDGDVCDAPDSEHYGLTWPGKQRARKLANQTPQVTLRAAPQVGVNEETSGNAIIVGDNLQVLLALQKSYANSFKVVYIDPPYNTGKDFLYQDTFAIDEDQYLRATQQADLHGRLVSNPKTSGRFHSSWLNFMFPRLRVARSLMSDGGVIFVSIDEHEVHNLRLIMDEIFGSENFVTTFSWVRTATPAALAAKTKKTVEYVLCYENVRSPLAYCGVEKPVQSSNPLLNQPNRISDLTFPANSVTTGLDDGIVEVGSYGTEKYSVEVLHAAEVKRGRFVTPLSLRARFRWTQKYLEQQLATGVRVHIATKKMIPSYEKDSYGREAPPNLIDQRVGVGTNEDATSELRQWLPDLPADALSRMHPKPVSLVSYLVDAVAGPGDLVLDFFAGSGTTGEAVLQLNAKDGGSRRFVLVQLPEKAEVTSSPPQFSTIDKILCERLRRVSKAMKAKGAKGDLGFRVFKEDSPALARPLHLAFEQVNGKLELFKEKLAPEQPADLFTEVLLLLEFPLDARREQVPQDSANTLWRFEHPRQPQPLLLCLDSTIDEDLLDALRDKKNHIFVCRDEALTDVAKARFYDALSLAKSTFKVL